MPLSHSPRLLPPAEITGDSRPKEDREDFFCTDLPKRTQDSPSLRPLQPHIDTTSMTPANRAIALPDSHHTQQAPMILDRESMSWAQGRFPNNSFVQDPSIFCTPALLSPDSACAGYPSQPYSGASYNTNYDLAYPPNYAHPSYPRVYSDFDPSGLPNDMSASYPPATFFYSPPQPHDTSSLPDAEAPELMQLNDEYDVHYTNNIKQEYQHDYMSPYSELSRASTPYPDGHEDDNPIDKEQPYAQLIFRALLDAPNHTMVLRDIYDWFKMYTDKAAQSETKGWQNSIRHNLSMNGAFEKVDSPSDSTQKGFMWRLTPSALREGVKSTTRYRSKAPNKRSTTRSQPLPQRQASGAKGGHAARRAANLRRSQRAREANPRSNPYGGYDSEWEGASAHGGDSPYPSRVDSPYSQYGSNSAISFSPYSSMHATGEFRPMLGMAEHLMSPPCSYASTPLSQSSTPMTATMSLADGMIGDAAYVLDQGPGEPLFSTSPTPSGDEPITPTHGRGMWEEDVAMGIDMYDELSYHGGS